MKKGKRPRFGLAATERNLPIVFGFVYAVVMVGTVILHWSVIAAQLTTWGNALPH